jgi:MtN3 and saliva related transmembrane protein
MALPDVLGYLAAILTTISFVPQVLHTWRTRKAQGVSLVMICLFSLGVALWLAYGLMSGAWPVVAANGVTLALSLALLGMKLRFDR